MMIYLMNWIGLEFLSKYFKYNSQTSWTHQKSENHSNEVSNKLTLQIEISIQTIFQSLLLHTLQQDKSKQNNHSCTKYHLLCISISSWDGFQLITQFNFSSLVTIVGN
jgi:hypothetical protein